MVLVNFSELYCDASVLQPVDQHPPQRWFRYSTAFLRKKPSFIIAGAQKSGTTSLYAWLTRHPQIIAPVKKEIYFFNNAELFNKGISWYKSFYPLSFRRGFSIDATANTFESENAAQRVKQLLPEAKVIIILRNPVDRAFSHFHMAVKLGFEKTSFEHALSLEEKRISEGKHLVHNYFYQRLAYRTKGIYADQLQPWLNHFPSHQLLVLQGELLFHEPKNTYESIQRFLGLEINFPQRFEARNQGETGAMNADIRKDLEAFYRPHNEKLYKLINKTYDW